MVETFTRLPPAVVRALAHYDETSERAAVAGSFTPEEAATARAEHKLARVALEQAITGALIRQTRAHRK